MQGLGDWGFGDKTRPARARHLADFALTGTAVGSCCGLRWGASTWLLGSVLPYCFG